MIIKFQTQDRRDQVLEARAAVTALNLWLKESPMIAKASPAVVRLEYDGAQLVAIIVTLDQ